MMQFSSNVFNLNSRIPTLGEKVFLILRSYDRAFKVYARNCNVLVEVTCVI